MNEQINKVSKINKKIMPQKPAKDNGALPLACMLILVTKVLLKN